MKKGGCHDDARTMHGEQSLPWQDAVGGRRTSYRKWREFAGNGRIGQSRRVIREKVKANEERVKKWWENDGTSVKLLGKQQ